MRERDYLLIGADVPCDGCTACCSNDMILLHPEHGDDPAQFETVPVRNPLTGEPALMLAHKPGGGCVYLGANGCKIHGRAPAICREFDCRKAFRRMSRPERRQALAAGLVSKAVLDAGRKRLHTLEA